MGDVGQEPPPIVNLVMAAAQKCQNKNAAFNTFIKESRLAECLTKKDRKKSGLMGHVKSFISLLSLYPDLKRTIERVYLATAADETAPTMEANTLSQLVKGARTAWNMADAANDECQTLPETCQPPSDVPLSDKLGGALTMKPRAAYQLAVVYKGFGWNARNLVLSAALVALDEELNEYISPSAAAAASSVTCTWVHETGFPNLLERHVRKARTDLGYVTAKENKAPATGECLHPGIVIFGLLSGTTTAHYTHPNKSCSGLAGCQPPSLQYMYAIIEIPRNINLC